MSAAQPLPPPLPADFYTLLLEAVPDALITIDGTGRIVYANAEAARIFGYDGDMRGTPIESLILLELRDEHRKLRARYMNEPSVRPMGVHFEVQGLRADGLSFPAEVALGPLRTSAGMFYNASIRDLSGTRIERQAVRRARYDALEVQASRTILDSADYAAAIDDVLALTARTLDAPSAVVLIGDASRPRAKLHVSADLSRGLLDGIVAKAERIVSLAVVEPQEAASGDAALSSDVRPDTTGGVFGRLRAAFPSLGEAGYADALIVALSDRNESLGFMLVLSRQRAYFDHDRRHVLQSIGNMLAAAVQRGRSEAQLAQAQRLDALGQLTGGIAHDFNNLLTVISGNLQLLEGAVDDDSAPLLASAARAVERGAALTERLLAFSRRRQLLPRTIWPAQLLGDLETMLRRTLGAQISLRVDCPRDIAAVFADPGELEAALVNLALNARDAMPNGGSLTISARERVIGPAQRAPMPEGRYVIFSVADTGTGMTPEVLEHVFEPFFSTKPKGKGSGMGLSMVHGFVRQSGGHVEIESQPGEGTIVQLWLRAADPADTAASAQTGRAHADETGAASRSAKETVLVVEDEPEVLQLALAFLHTLGYRTLSASDADGALAQLKAHPRIDVLFTDVVLGVGPSGLELATRMQARRKGLAVLLTSGYEFDAARLAPNSFELLRKPYRRERLGEALRRVIRRAREQAG